MVRFITLGSERRRANYLEPLEALADRRRVIFYDQLGCGQSDRPEQYVLDRQPDLESLTLCGSPASMIRWVADCEQLLQEEPAPDRS